MDPPFFTQQVHKTAHGEFAFNDEWSDLSQYLQYLQQRIAFVETLLADKGSFVLHCDPRTSYRLRIVCDQSFGPENFQDEIIWSYKRWPSKSRRLQRFHDVLLRYTRGAEPTFNQLYEPLSPSTISKYGTAKQGAKFSDGARTHSEATEEESPGMPLGDVWNIPVIPPRSKERNGYPTQKPEALLERLILLTTNPGDTVLDPCCGSGTTLAAAVKLGRNAIGIDMGAVAISTTSARLRELGFEPVLYSVR
jgi:site-specific DNA-methyltransferase (adenine-specific)